MYTQDILIRKNSEEYTVNIHVKESYVLQNDAQDVVNTILQIYHNKCRKDAKELSPKIKEMVLSKDYILKHVCYKMINAENVGDLPNRRILDMAAVYQIVLSNSKDESFTVNLQKDLLKALGISRKELDAASVQNMKKKGILFINMTDMLLKMIGLPTSGKSLYSSRVPKDAPIFIVTTEEQRFGASLVLFSNVFKNISNELDSDLLILPSSANELIIFQDDDTVPIKDLQKVITGINIDRPEVRKKDILTDSVYRFRRKTGKLEIAVKG